MYRSIKQSHRCHAIGGIICSCYPRVSAFGTGRMFSWTVSQYWLLFAALAQNYRAHPKPLFLLLFCDRTTSWKWSSATCECRVRSRSSLRLSAATLCPSQRRLLSGSSRQKAASASTIPDMLELRCIHWLMGRCKNFSQYICSYVFLCVQLICSYLTCRADACARQTPSAEATARAQCTSPTDLKVDRTSLKLWQASLRRKSQWVSQPQKQPKWPPWWR